MRWNWQLWAMALVTTMLTGSTFVVFACPYCPPTDATLGEKLAESDAACVVQFVDSKNGEELSMQTTTFQVVRLLHAKENRKKGSEITTSFGLTAKPGDQFLLMGQLKEGSMEWSLPIPIDELGSEVNYLLKAPAPERPQIERLSYFLRYLDSDNPTISNDAFGEFSKANFEDVEQLSLEFSRKKIRGWLDDPNPQLDVRRAFYGMLLGLCGNDEDAAFLEKKILAPIDARKNRLGIEGMMGGYLVLRGQAGLQSLLEKTVDSLSNDLASDDPRIGDLNALRMTLSFLWDYRRTQFTEEPLRAAMRRFLDRPEFAELAIVDLARWKDWGSLDPLIEAYGRSPWETPMAKEKIIGFALSCRKDVSGATETKELDRAARAQSFLDRLDPEFVQSVKRNMGGLNPLPKPAVKPKDDDEGRS